MGPAPPIPHREPGTMRSPFCIAPLLLLQFASLTWALPWDLPTCPLPAPPPPPAQHVLSPDVGVDGNSTKKKTDLTATKIIHLLLPRQITTCQRVTCNSQYYCCNDQTCSFQLNKWVCLWATRIVTTTSTYRSTTTSTSTTTLSFTSTTWNTITTRTYVSSTSVWTTTVTVTSTDTETSLTTSSITLTKRGMPTPTPIRCVRRPEEEEKRRRELAKRADPTIYVTTTIVVTATPPSTYFFTTTWLYTYWITGQTTTTLTAFVHVDRTATVTSTDITTTTTIATVTETTTTKAPTPIDVKVGAGVGGGVGGLVVIALVAMLIWKKCRKPTAEEEWAGNQPVEDRNAPPGGAGPGMVMVGPGGVVLAAGATNKVPYKPGYYDQNGNVVMTETSPSPPPAPPPVAYFQPAQYPQGYPGLSSPFLPSPPL